MINRKIQPSFEQIDKIEIIEAQKHVLSNKIPLYYINSESHDVVKIDFLFWAGSYYQESPLIALATNTMLNDGTKTQTSHEIAEKLDFYGAHLQLNTGKHFASISLFTLNKYLPQTIAIVEDIIKNSIFPEKEFKTYVEKRKQQHIIESAKVENMARKRFSEVVFGTGHPYGMSAEIKDYENLTTKQLKAFYLRHYSINNCQIMASGSINNETINIINQSFGGNNWNNAPKVIEKIIETKPERELKHYLPKKGAVQSAIRIGKECINKTHKDYAGLQVLNTILGGYFGSRLMANIREDKGYTYGINSILASLKHTGYFIIVSEVGAKVSKKAVNEIFTEIKKIREELIPEKELSLVKNYLLGEILRIFDGPFALADSFVALLEYDLDYEYYYNLITTVKNITSESLKELANKYLVENSIYEVVAGKI